MTYPTFPTTDVPIACLFIHLQHGYTIEQFLRDFPEVSETQVQDLLEWVTDASKKPDLMAAVIIDPVGSDDE